jgi:two-component system response regulator
VDSATGCGAGEKFVPEAAATEKTGYPIILIAEDNEDDVVLLRWAFERAGLGKSVVFVRDGEEAVKYLGRQAPFDDLVLCPMPTLVLLDGRMPKMDALDVLVWLSQHREVEPPNILVYTSALTPEQRVRAVTLGAKACMEKPVTGADWSRLVQQLKRFSGGVMLML